MRGLAVIVLAVSWAAAARADAGCDPKLPRCASSSTGGKKVCDPFWLIPGKATDCTASSDGKREVKRLITIDSNSVSVSPSPIKLPGCFTITMKANLQQIDAPKNYFAKVEYNWLNLPQFSSLPCQNASTNGCGGYGNNCYYCDICNSLTDVNNANSKSSIVSQFKKISCPDKAGPYDFKREFCFNDFSDLDKDGDCKLDFLQNGQAGETYQDALKNLKKLGYGTVVAKFTLASNATTEQLKKKDNKEAEILKSVDDELQTQRTEKNWALNDQQYITFRDWYVQNRKDIWHKTEYLPWLLYYNQVGCMAVSFEVCDKQPIPSTSGPNAFQCPPSS